MNTKAEIFLSYCWADEKIADEIYDYLVMNSNINLHRDKIDIGIWESIKKYMESIPNMDFVVLLISDSYLKSPNCMYEVMEVMRDRNYQNKIFPVIINKGIYNPVIRANYVIYWQKQYEELNNVLKEVDIPNLGRLGDDLKRRQDISSNIANFLDLVSDLNNPSIENIGISIENKLKEFNIISATYEQGEEVKEVGDLFDSLNIPKINATKAITDIEIARFMIDGFKTIKELLERLCIQLQTDNREQQFYVEHINTRESFFQFYHNGRKIGGLKLFLSDSLGSTNIGIANTTHYYSGNNTWNAMYSANVENGKIYFKETLSLGRNNGKMNVEDVVKDIWMKHIQPHIENR